MKRIGLLYAVNGNADYQTLVMQSFSSARGLSPNIEIRVCVFGAVQSDLKRFAKKLNVQIVKVPAAAGSLASGLKWFALGFARDWDRVLVVDADTAFYKPVELIFKKHTDKDFYAQIEFGTEADHTRGSRFVAKRIDDRRMKRLRKELASAPMPVFNSAAMLFNHQTHRRVVERLPSFVEFFSGFHAGTLDYPCSEPFITEEVCGSLILGLSPRLSWQELSKTVVTHYQTWRSGGYKHGHYGVLMHIGNSELLNWLRDDPGLHFRGQLRLCFKMKPN